MGIKVPPGFVITSDTCKDFFKGEQTVLNHLFDSLKSSVSKLEHETGKSFFFTDESQTNSKPLLLSVRSSVVVEMPR